MGLKLGKSFDRNYNLRLPFLDGHYDVGIYFNRKSTFLLFSVKDGIRGGDGVKVNMFKNLESSKFCEAFINLHNYRKHTLDIVNQFKEVKPDYFHEISFILNETLTLGKYEVDEDKVLYDCLNIYGFTMNSYMNEFIYIITERQNIVKKLNRKIVRTSGLQIATGSALKLLNEYHQDSLSGGKEGTEPPLIDVSESIRLDNGD
jgi:hypothetical protein